MMSVPSARAANQTRSWRSGAAAYLVDEEAFSVRLVERLPVRAEPQAAREQLAQAAGRPSLATRAIPLTRVLLSVLVTAQCLAA